jgi:diketogulonate reductase-like aldo/keto reductase
VTGRVSRRVFAGGLAAATLLPAAAPGPLLKTIPSSGERLPAIGMGSWLTFDVGSDSAALAARTEVLSAFFAAGGRLIDSSPMYGSSQAVIGAALDRLRRPAALFAADKVWTRGEGEGRAQIKRSRERWRVERFDLLQVHNLLDWRTQLETLFAMKADGRLRYVGITSYDGIAYDEVEAIMRRRPIDFVQISYNLADRRAEARLLPLAADRGIGVVVNRPFQEGRLMEATRRRPLPALAREVHAANWAQYLLKFIVAHPAVTVAIPATRQVAHMRENMGALAGPMPDTTQRRAMAVAYDV